MGPGAVAQRHKIVTALEAGHHAALAALIGHVQEFRVRRGPIRGQGDDHARESCEGEEERLSNLWSGRVRLGPLQLRT